MLSKLIKRTYHNEMADYMRDLGVRKEHIELITMHSRTIMKYRILPALIAALRSERYTERHNRRILNWFIDLLGLIDVEKMIKKEGKNENK